MAAVKKAQSLDWAFDFSIHRKIASVQLTLSSFDASKADLLECAALLQKTPLRCCPAPNRSNRPALP
jgi:hypothetical protein